MLIVVFLVEIITDSLHLRSAVWMLTRQWLKQDGRKASDHNTGVRDILKSYLA